MSARILLFVGSYTHESPVGIHVFDASDPTGRLVELSRFDGRRTSIVPRTASERRRPVCGQRDGGSRGREHRGASCRSARRLAAGARPCPQPWCSTVPCQRRPGRPVSCTSPTTCRAPSPSTPSSTPDVSGTLVATHQHSGSGPSARQEGPHAHCIVPGPVGDSVYAVDLGTDRVSQYVHDVQPTGEEFRLDAELVIDAGAGPRHLAFHPEQPAGFLVCELDSTIETARPRADDRALDSTRSHSTLPDDFEGESIAAEVRVHPNGRYVYVSNRGHDSIAVFGFAGPGEPLEPLGHVPSGGQTPRNFAVHPSGRALLVANQDSNTHRSRSRSTRDRRIPSQLDGTYRVSEPVCLTFSETGR